MTAGPAVTDLHLADTNTANILNEAGRFYLEDLQSPGRSQSAPARAS